MTRPAGPDSTAGRVTDAVGTRWVFPPRREVSVVPKGDVETYHEGGKWHVKVEGDSQPQSSHDTGKEAKRAGRELAKSRRVEHIIRRMDGTIGERERYGRDPRKVRG